MITKRLSGRPASVYVWGIKADSGERALGFMSVVDKPSVAGELPNFIPLNLEIRAPGGNISVANGFRADESEGNGLLLALGSVGFERISLLKTDGSTQETYLLNGISVPIREYSRSEKTVVLLVRYF